LASLKTFHLTTAFVSTTWRLTFLSGALEKIVFPVGNAGLNVKDVVPETLEQVLAPQREGPPAVPAQVRVVRVPRASAAEKAGLRVGDVITAVNGKPISKALEVVAFIATHPKARVALTVMRVEGKRTVTVAVGPPEATQTPKLSRRAARHLYAATRLLIEGKTDEAERALKQLKEMGEMKKLGNRERAAVENNLGVLYETKDEMGEAIRHYQRAVQTEPKVALYRMNLSRALRNIGNSERAAAELETATQLAPRWLNARLELALVYELLDRRAVALEPTYASAYAELRGEESFRKAIELNPNAAFAYNRLGIIDKERGKLDEAEQMYCKAIELDPNHANAYNQLGNFLRERGRLDEAEKRVNAALQLDSKSADAYSALGGIDRARGQFEEEEEAYRKAIAVYPPQVAEVVWLYQNLASLLADRGIKLDEALQLAQKVVKAQPGNAAYTEILGWVHYKRGELAEAEAALKKSIELYGQDAKRSEPLGKLGLVYEKKGEREAAREAWREALKLDPHNKEAKAGWERLEKE
jgi:tetratricopeptide (TPR) repeat protein